MSALPLHQCRVSFGRIEQTYRLGTLRKRRGLATVSRVLAPDSLFGELCRDPIGQLGGYHVTTPRDDVRAIEFRQHCSYAMHAEQTGFLWRQNDVADSCIARGCRSSGVYRARESSGVSLQFLRAKVSRDRVS